MIKASLWLGSCAIAAGLASPAQAAAADTFYVGVQFGWQQTADHYHGYWQTTPPIEWDLGKHTGEGAAVGVHAGVERPLGTLFVGAEADLGVNSAKVDYVINGWNMTARTKAQGSVRARVGFTSGNAQFYATGGVAIADTEHTYRNTAPGPAEFYRQSRTMIGYTVGAGVGYRLNDRVSARFEYRYSDFGRMATQVNPAWLEVDMHRVKTNSASVAISYRL